MTTPRKIIELWPSTADFAADIGITPSHARVMISRDSISGKYWHRIAEAAKARSLAVDLERLAQAHARKDADQ